MRDKRFRPSHRKPRVRPRRSTVVRALGFSALGALAMWFSAAVSAAAVFGDPLPEVGRKWAPWDARVAAEIAERRLQASGNSAEVEQAAELARSALRRDPTVVPAWRTLGLAASSFGRSDEASRMFAIANLLSRRDLTTQLWLIEDSVQRNDVATTLRHYDYALRTSRSAVEILLPVLVTATGEDELVGPIADLVAGDPPWAPSFFDYFARLAPSAENAAALLERVRAAGYSHRIRNAEALPARLAREGDYAEAHRAYRALLQGDMGIAAANDQFARSPKLLPFDWEFAGDANLRAEPLLRNAEQDSSSLLIVAADGEIGTAARKLLILEPGNYRLATSLVLEGSSRPSRARWRLSCASSDATLLRLDITPNQRERVARSGLFAVPAGCEAQWAVLDVVAPEGFEPAQFWIDTFAIAPQPAAQRPASRN